jgi:NAD(P)-dependent dehydrogenase (short-subunit alcohol dehydrogenase family)
MLEHFDVSRFVFSMPAVIHQHTGQRERTPCPFSSDIPTSQSPPKFIAILSVAGSLTIGPTMPLKMVAYSKSKAALNFVVRKLHQENEGLRM